MKFQCDNSLIFRPEKRSDERVSLNYIHQNLTQKLAYAMEVGSLRVYFHIVEQYELKAWSRSARIIKVVSCYKFIH